MPFVRRGVNALHLIPLPFPKVWHKDEDTMQNIDRNIVSELASILRVFMYEYLRAG